SHSSASTQTVTGIQTAPRGVKELRQHITRGMATSSRTTPLRSGGRASRQPTGNQHRGCRLLERLVGLTHFQFDLDLLSVICVLFDLPYYKPLLLRALPPRDGEPGVIIELNLRCEGAGCLVRPFNLDVNVSGQVAIWIAAGPDRTQLEATLGIRLQVAEQPSVLAVSLVPGNMRRTVGIPPPGAGLIKVGDRLLYGPPVAVNDSSGDDQRFAGLVRSDDGCPRRLSRRTDQIAEPRPLMCREEGWVGQNGGGWLVGFQRRVRPVDPLVSGVRFF